MNQVAEHFNGRDPVQITIGIGEGIWAVLLFPNLHLGSMGWLGSNAGEAMPFWVAMLMIVGATILIFSKPNNAQMFLGLLPMAGYCTISTLAVMSGETRIPVVATLQTAFPVIIGLVYMIVRTNITSIAIGMVGREIDKRNAD